MLRLIVVSLLLVPVAMAASFDSPASFQGTATAEASGWLFGVLDPGQIDRFHIDAEAGQSRIHERVESSTSAGPLGSLYQVDREGRPPEWTATEAWSADAQGQPVAFLLQVDRQELNLSGNATWSTLAAGERIEFADEAVLRLSTLDNANAVPGVLSVVEGRLVSALAASQSEWYGLECSACPTPEETVVQQGGHDTTIHRSVEFAAPQSVSLNATGTFYFTSERSDWIIDGAVRLPLFDQEGATRTLEGTTNVTDLRQSDGARLAADVSGTWSAVFQDERLDMTWVTVAGGAVLAGGISLLLAGFVAKEILAEPLTNQNRHLLYRNIQERPGLHFRELQRATGFGNGALLYSLRVLASARLIRTERLKGRKHFYAVASVDYHAGDALLQRIPPQRIEQALRPILERGTMRRADLVRHLHDRGESRATAYRLVRLLQEAEVLQGEQTLAVRRVPAGADHLLPKPTNLAVHPRNRKRPHHG